MAVIQSGAGSTTLLTVDPTFLAARVANRPPEILGGYQVSTSSGAIVTPGANAPLFSLRWSPPTATNLCMIRRIEIGAFVAAAVTTSQQVSISMQVARSFTVADSGGTAISFSAANTNKLRTSMPPTAFSGGGDMRIASTAALTAGTRTLDTNLMGTAVGTSGTAAGTTIIPMTAIFQQQTGDYPLILAASEGIIIANNVSLATGSLTLVVNLEWFEIAATGTNVSY